MLIALDFDKTYSADHELWDEFIVSARSRGHEVILATYRDRDYDYCELLEHIETKMKVPVYMTKGVAKAWFLQHFGPGSVDIWIDDNVHSIINNSVLNPEQLEKWREEGRKGTSK